MGALVSRGGTPWISAHSLRRSENGTRHTGRRLPGVAATDAVTQAGAGRGLTPVVQLCPDQYHGFNGRHFSQIARREHGVTSSCSFVKHALQPAAPLRQGLARGQHHRRRTPRACFGELLDIDGTPTLALCPNCGVRRRHQTGSRYWKCRVMLGQLRNRGPRCDAYFPLSSY